MTYVRIKRLQLSYKFILDIMGNFSSEGLVIKRKDIGEADKIVTIFAKNQGKVSAIAKGVRKVSSRRAPNLELLNQIKFFRNGRGKLPVLTEVDSISNFTKIKGDLKKLSLAYLLLELIDQFLPEGQENNNLYNQLILFLGAIDQSDSEEKDKVLAASFQIKLLREMGYLPELYHCIRCGNRLEQKENYLAPHLGGLIDKNCSRESLVARSIKVDSIKIIRFINSEPIGKIGQLKLNDIDIKEICKLLNLYTTYYLDKELGSERFALEIEKLALSLQ